MTKINIKNKKKLFLPSSFFNFEKILNLQEVMTHGEGHKSHSSRRQEQFSHFSLQVPPCHLTERTAMAVQY